MKSGKSAIIVLTTILLTYFLIVKNMKNKNYKKPTADQYKNRLNEFCLFDIEEAKIEFNSFLELGFNAKDAFELTIVKRVYV
jgi:hypothetical protein